MNNLNIYNNYLITYNNSEFMVILTKSIDILSHLCYTINSKTY